MPDGPRRVNGMCDSRKLLELIQRGEAIAGTSSAAGVLQKDAVLLQFADVTQGRILRTLGELGVFGASEKADEAIEQAIDNRSLPIVDGKLLELLPNLRFVQNRSEALIGRINSSAQAG